MSNNGHHQHSIGVRASAAVCLALTALLALASTSNAYSTYYSPSAVSCVQLTASGHAPNVNANGFFQGLVDDTLPAVSIGTQVTIPRPMDVYGYSGTANLYWAPFVRITLNATGQSFEMLATTVGVVPYTWFLGSNFWLSNILWNGQQPAIETAIDIPAGVTMTVWGATYWRNSSGTYFYKELEPLGACRA